MGHGLRSTSVLLVALVQWGCFGVETTVFPDGLEPLEDNRAVAPPRNGDGAYPESLGIARGYADGTYWVHARGHLAAPISAVWAAARDPEVCADRRKVDRWQSTPDVEMEYPFSYRIHNEVDDIIFVEFDVTWRHGPVEGTIEAPEIVAGRWQKTWGSTVIEVLAGSVVLRRVGDDITEVELIEHLQATASTGDEAESYLRDYFASMGARAKGSPLPTY